MAVSFVKHIGTSFVKVAGTTLDAVWPLSSAAGNLIIACFVFDNATTDKPVITNITKPAGETATWVFIGAARSPGSTSGAASSGEMWVIKTTVDWITPTITTTFDMSMTQKSVIFSEYSGVDNTLRNTVGIRYSTNTTAASASTTGTTPVIGDLAVGMLFGSNIDVAQEGDTDTLGGTWSTKGEVGSTGGATNTNNFGITQYKVLTTASHQTYNNSTVMTANNGSIVAIFMPSSVAVGGKGRPKVWNGSAWVQKPAKVWTGSAWVEKPMKVWTGSQWKILT